MLICDMFGVVNLIVELINGVFIVNKMNKIDIINMVVLVKLLMIFKVVNFFVDNNKKIKKIINEINDIVMIGIVLIRFLFF